MAGIGLADVGEIVHGTTLVTNAVIERKGAKLGLITTRGFRDILEMGTEQRYDIYDLFLTFPEPLVVARPAPRGRRAHRPRRQHRRRRSMRAAVRQPACDTRWQPVSRRSRSASSTPTATPRTSGSSARSSARTSRTRRSRSRARSSPRCGNTSAASPPAPTPMSSR